MRRSDTGQRCKCYQRWSRGHKARQRQGQHFRGQTHSRPRTGMLEGKAKDQGHRRKCSPKKKKRSPKVFSGDLQKKSLQNNFSGEFLRGLQKMSSQNFREVSCVFQRTFKGSKNSAVLEPRTGQSSRT